MTKPDKMHYVVDIQTTGEQVRARRNLAHWGSCVTWIVQIPDQVECLVVFACWKQAHDLYVSLLFVKYLYIFQYVTQNSTFTKQNTLSIILILITIYTLVSGVHVCNKVI